MLEYERWLAKAQEDLNDAKLAIKQASEIVKFVIKKISAPGVSQMEIR